MVNRHNYKNLQWIDLESPTREEVLALTTEFDINALVAEELLQPTFKPRAELHRNLVYLILHFPTATGKVNQPKEVDFIVGKDFIITTHYDAIDPLHQFSKLFEVNSILDRSNIGDHAGFIFFYMIRELYRALSFQLDNLGDSLHKTEEQIFRGHEKEMVIELSRFSRTLLDFKNALGGHRDTLESFTIAGHRFFGAEFDFYLNGVIGEYGKVERQITADSDFLVELRETNNSLLSTKENEIMKTLTIMAFITFPLTLIASIFGMNTKELPIVGLSNDFWIVIGVMALLTGGMFVFFKHKKWL